MMKWMRGIPPWVTQEKLKPKKSQIETRGTSKETVTEVDPKCTNLNEASIYYATSEKYISMVSEELKWVIKEKDCFKVETCNVEKLRFLRMNCTKKYNNKLGGVGITDNPSNYYVIFFGVWKRKWWWYIFFWAVFVILMNAYMIYICIHNMHVSYSKETWINPS